MKIINHIVQSIRSLSEYNSQVERKPHVIIWTDEDKQWESIIPDLLNELPELFILGMYDKIRQGPSIWLRCVIAGKIQGINIPEDKVPILYLPGISRSKLRAVETCEKSLKPLAELQYRGKIWSQINSKDWTVVSFLENKEKGLGLTVSKDQDTKNYLLLSLPKLVQLETDILKNNTIQKDYLQSLIRGDSTKEILQWLNSPNTFQDNLNHLEWESFLDLMKDKYEIDVVKDGILTAAKKLLERLGKWDGVWNRYLESYSNYPGIKDLLMKVQTPDLGFFPSISEAGKYFAWNQAQESNLRNDLLNLKNLSRENVIQKVDELEKAHHDRRNQIWFLLGESSYVDVLQYLYNMAIYTKKSLKLQNIEEIAEQYFNEGWNVDANMLRALNSINSIEMEEVVHSAIQAIYMDWANESAAHLQDLFLLSLPSYESKKSKYEDGEVVLFVDGLRMDTAKILVSKFGSSKFKISERKTWAPIPSVTATGKIAVSPIGHLASGSDGNKDFEPSIQKTNQLLTQYHFHKVLNEEGWEILSDSYYGNGVGKAWMEFGNIDSQGHSLKWELAKLIEPLLNKIKDKVIKLLESGWKKVRIVTDHGWLLLPTGLPKNNLPEIFVDTKWARCAIIKQNQSTSEKQFPWHWNPNQMVALSYGIGCYQKNEQYAHGGLSLQESVTMEIIIEGETLRNPSKSYLTIRWIQLKCEIELDPNLVDKVVDIRRKAGDMSSSLVNKTKKINKNGEVSLFISDDDYVGETAWVVVTDNSSAIITQIETIIGGN